MITPRIGVSLPTFGPHAGAAAVVTVATAVERLGFHSVSATERLLLPATPDWRNTAELPESPVYDPIEMLTWAAAHTRRIRLATTIVNALFQPPIVLARRLATLDQLSGGRVDVGIGQGWLPEEFVAAGVPITRCGAGFEDHLAAMRACWAPDPVAHDGPRYRIPRARVGPKPVNGHLPVLIGAVAQPAVERAARLGAGFISGLRDWETTRAEIEWYRSAGGAGPVVVLIAPGPDDREDPVAPSRDIVASMLDNLALAVAAGVDEVHWGLLLLGLDPQRQVDVLEAFAAALEARTKAEPRGEPANDRPGAPATASTATAT